MGAFLVQAEHHFTLSSDVLLERLVLLDLNEDCVHDAGGRFEAAQSLFSVGQPIDKVLECVVELSGLFQGDFQFDLLVVGSVEDVVPALFQGAQVVLQRGGGTVGGTFQVVGAALQSALNWKNPSKKPSINERLQEKER